MKRNRNYGLHSRQYPVPVLTWPEKILLIGVAVAIVLIGLTVLARSDTPTCPPNTTCKVITVTPQEEQTLLGPNAILDMAVWAMRPLRDWADLWREKLRTAPAGKPHETPSAQEKLP